MGEYVRTAGQLFCHFIFGFASKKILAQFEQGHLWLTAMRISPVFIPE